MASLLLTLMAEGRSQTRTLDLESSSQLGLGTPATVLVEASDGAAEARPARGFELLSASGEPVARAPLPSDGEAVLGMRSAHTGQTAVLYARPSTTGARSFYKLGFSCDAEVLVGRSEEAGLRYASPFVSERHATLSLVGDSFSVSDLGSANGTFVNGRLIEPNVPVALRAGDVVSVLDLTLMVGRRFVSLNRPAGLTLGRIAGAAPLDHAAFRELCPPASETSGELPLFFPAPRLAHSIHRKAFQIDEPPQPKQPDDKPAIMQMGPSFIMGLASVFSASTAIQRIAQGGDLMSGLPSVAMCVAMLSGMVIWPVISRRYTKRHDHAEELRRQARYTDYLNGMEARFGQECDRQAEILRLRRVPVGELAARAHALSPRLMNRGVDHDDFMDLRVGVGSVELEADFRWPQPKFTMDEDKLLDKVSELSKNPPLVRDVPIAFDPVEHFVAGIIGARPDVWAFARGLVLQICALYSYQDVKIVLVADADEEAEWSFARSLPHLFDDSGTRRYLACDYDALTQVSMHLERELESRADARCERVGDLGAYYVVLCASKSLSERSEAVSRLQRTRENKGFSLVFFGEALRDLPRECAYVIDLSAHGVLADLEGSSQILGDAAERGSARMFDRDDVAGTMVPFEPDSTATRELAGTFALDLARARLDMPSQRSQMPSSLGFLEMFEVSNLAQLNVGQRWAEDDASRTLQTPVGRDAAGELSVLNLHENVHGPHGLIAGTTGSGKSEFIITYILSLCVNYAPDQVSFVLIDYKGGGLAGAFDNERYRLPHLAGTITNLDGAAIARSLVSIKSELKRRQDAFNRAREITGEATVDIYKYLRYYRQGVLSEPLPHLFIVADEFAELKQQEPEFMEELISAARIGRSLGVHLILATQKPSGVVNDQIWSNSRFKVCLKVADAADSKEMIRRPDAAEIKGPGRFFMLVGYNELFCGGQAAYAGAPYAPTEVFEPKRDDTVDLVDDTGDVVATMRPPSTATVTSDSELNAVLGQLCRTAEATGKHAGRLWLDALPGRIRLDDLREKYGFAGRPGRCEVALGEVDDPGRQRQLLYSVDLAEVGNLLVFGAQGSGAEGLVATLLCSLATDYAPEEACFYVMDFGAGTLSPFSALPQCGGVVLPGDPERMDNLFRLIDREVARRRALLSAEGVSLEEYNAAHDEKIGHMVVVLANIAAFYDLYGGYEEALGTLTRDAPRCGIHFVLTASSASAARPRLRSNFSESVVCPLNDESDLITILGSRPKAVVPKRDKRGYVVMAKEVYEFQGASVGGADQSEAALIAALGERRAAECAGRAPQIPSLPPVVRPQDMGLGPVACGELPIGFSKHEVEPMFFSFVKCPTMLVLGNDVDAIARYLRGVRECLAEAGTVDYLFVDPQGYLGETGDERVVQDEERVGAAIAAVATGRDPVAVLVLTSVVETMASLPDASARLLKEYIAKEQGKGVTGIVAATEMWRGKSLYDEWYKVVTAYGNGLWVGSGFSEQTLFRFSRVLPEFRAPAATDDAFFAMRGDVTSVRLVSASDEEEGEAR